MKKLLFAVTAIALVSTTSCKKEKWPYCIKANGDLIEETRVLSDFDEVEFDLSGNLYITQDSDIKSPEIRIKTSENIMDRIETDVKGNTLVIADEKCIRKLKSFDAYLVVSDLEKVSLNGSGQIKSQGEFDVNNLTLNINGSGDITFDAVTEEALLEINGSGNIKVNGNTDDLEVDINGSGNIHAFGFRANTAYVRINGSGKTEVDVVDQLDVDITGSGDVIYEGTPRVSINNSGSGSVKSR